jgi:3-oxoacyl-[acyl-carrier protein] reductase
MLLRDKNAAVYGAGEIGAAVARAFAAEGASVFLASRSGSRAEEIAAAIRDGGGSARVGTMTAATVNVSAGTLIDF